MNHAIARPAVGAAHRGTGRLLERIGAAFAAWGGARRTARDRRAAVRELRRLSPALLADIGLSRDDAEAVVDALLARREAWRAPAPRVATRGSRPEQAWLA